MASTFKFSHSHDDKNFSSGSTITMETDAVSLEDLLIDFSQFLAGCGFMVTPGSIYHEEERSDEPGCSCCSCGPVTFGKEGREAEETPCSDSPL